jgi:hypothetical protein
MNAHLSRQIQLQMAAGLRGPASTCRWQRDRYAVSFAPDWPASSVRLLQCKQKKQFWRIPDVSSSDEPRPA